MPHRITITGIPVSNVKKHGKLLSFVIQASGSTATPKGLPKPSKKVFYRVYINQRQLNKAKLADIDLTQKNLLIQGEPVIGPIKPQSAYELGVTCFQLKILEIKKKDIAPKGKLSEIKTHDKPIK